MNTAKLEAIVTQAIRQALAPFEGKVIGVDVTADDVRQAVRDALQSLHPVRAVSIDAIEDGTFALTAYSVVGESAIRRIDAMRKGGER